LCGHWPLKKLWWCAEKPSWPVLGADTLVFINGHVLGKPRNKQHAAEILNELSGAWQKVYTGVALVREGGKRIIARVAVSSVKTRRLSEDDICRMAGRHLDKAGAYAVQEKRDRFVTKIKGDYDNVVGLPMREVKKILRGLA
jgi:septum formation protein